MPVYAFPTNIQPGDTGQTSWANSIGTTLNQLGPIVDTKAADNAVVKLTGNQSVAGVKTFSSAPSVPDASFSIAKTSGLQTALDLKAPLASPAFTGTPTGITKAHVGLSNVDNISDANKPVSTATQTALNLKINASEKGANSGVATLDVTGKVPVAQLPETGGAVSSVNSKTGAVVLDLDDVLDPTMTIIEGASKSLLFADDAVVPTSVTTVAYEGIAIRNGGGEETSNFQYDSLQITNSAGSQTTVLSDGLSLNNGSGNVGVIAGPASGASVYVLMPSSNGTLATIENLSNRAPGCVYYYTSDWYYNDAVVTYRPSYAYPLLFIATMDETATPPEWMADYDVWIPHPDGAGA